MMMMSLIGREWRGGDGIARGKRRRLIHQGDEEDLATRGLGEEE